MPHTSVSRTWQRISLERPAAVLFKHCDRNEYVVYISGTVTTRWNNDLGVVGEEDGGYL